MKIDRPEHGMHQAPLTAALALAVLGGGALAADPRLTLQSVDAKAAAAQGTANGIAAGTLPVTPRIAGNGSEVCDAGHEGLLRLVAKRLELCVGGEWQLLNDYNQYLAFLSQGLIFGDAGIAAADAMCQAEASAAGLPGTFLAWLSTSTLNAKDRLGSDGPWFNTQRQRIAATLDDLTDGTLENPITYDAAGDEPASPPYNLWPYTGTQADGTAAAGMTCGDWTMVTGEGVSGYADRTSAQWTNFGTPGCNGQLNVAETGYVGRAVYCFQVP